MSRSNDAGHFFQTTSALEATTRKAAKSKNTRGDPVKLGAKLLAVHPDPAHEGAFYVAEATGEVKRVVLETGEVQRVGITASAPLTSLAVDDRATTLYAGCWDKNIYCAALGPTAAIHPPPTTRLTGHTDFVKCLLSTSLNGQPILISGGADATLIIWDLATARALHKLPTTSSGARKAALQALAIDPLSVTAEAFTLFTASSDREIRRWRVTRDAATELADAAPLRAHETSVYALRFDADGDLWSASADKTARRLVRARAWTPDTVLAHPDFVRDVWVAEEGGWVVTACRDEAVRVWDAATGKVVCCYSGHFEEVTGLGTWGPGGTGVVSVSVDGTLRRWRLERAAMEKFLEEVRREEEEGVVGEEEGKGVGQAGVLTAEEEAELAELMEDDEDD
nr:putative wd repeat-containing protein [Quercus suber]